MDKISDKMQKLEDIRWAYTPLAANLGALIKKQNNAV
jgi:hypothetical protein